MRLCKYCHQERPESKFTVCRVVGEKVYYRLHCAVCVKSRWKKRTSNLRLWLIEYKKTHPCLDCGCADHRALVFHHDDAAEKEFTLAAMVRQVHSRERISREIEKCIVLCANCHSIRHAVERQTSLALGLSPASASQDLAFESSTTEMSGKRKVCRYCSIEQDEKCFEVCKTIGDKVYRRHKCRGCKVRTQSQRRDKLRTWLENVKKTLFCTECGFADYRALEFHHPDGQDKDFAIGVMVKDNRSIAAVEREIAKCIVLCANCHRIEHYVESK